MLLALITLPQTIHRPCRSRSRLPTRSPPRSRSISPPPPGTFDHCEYSAHPCKLPKDINFLFAASRYECVRLDPMGLCLQRRETLHKQLLYKKLLYRKQLEENPQLLLQRPRSTSPSQSARVMLPRIANSASDARLRAGQGCDISSSALSLLSDGSSLLQRPAKHQKNGKNVLPAMQLSIQHSQSTPALDSKSSEGISLSTFEQWGSIEQTSPSQASAPGSGRSLGELPLFPLPYDHVSKF